MIFFWHHTLNGIAFAIDTFVDSVDATPKLKPNQSNSFPTRPTKNSHQSTTTNFGIDLRDKGGDDSELHGDDIGCCCSLNSKRRGGIDADHAVLQCPKRKITETDVS